MQSLYLERIMKKKAAKGSKKTNPKQIQFLQRPKMNVNLFATKDYDNINDWTLGENKPNQSQFTWSKHLDDLQHRFKFLCWNIGT
jgi:hypothetical protein